MRKLFVSSLKMLYRDKQSLFWALMFPVIFAVVFGLFDLDSGPPINVAVVAPVENQVSKTVISSLDKVDNFNLDLLKTASAARRRLSDGKEDVVLVLPSGGGNQAILYYNPNRANTNGTALGAIQQVIQGINLQAARATPIVALKTQSVSARTIKYYDFLLPGLVAMGVMNFAVTGMAIALARFREQRILKRILATPLAPAKFLSAQVGARMVLSFVQAAIITAVGVTLFGAHIYGSVLAMFFFAALSSIVFLNLGFAIAGRAPNPDAAQGVSQAVVLPMMFLSGVFFPTSTLPDVLQKVVKYLPLTPLIKALRKIALDGASITALGGEVALLGVWVLVSFVLAQRNFRFAKA